MHNHPYRIATNTVGSLGGHVPTSDLELIRQWNAALRVGTEMEAVLEGAYRRVPGETNAELEARLTLADSVRSRTWLELSARGWRWDLVSGSWYGEAHGR